MDINEQADEGQTALHHACEVCDEQCVEMHLRRGAQENLPDNDGRLASNVVGDLVQVRSDWDIGEEVTMEIQQRIRRMLERAPADRAWSRRGWLVLCRSYPNRVNSPYSPRSAKKLTASEASGVQCRDNFNGDVRQVVGKVIGLEADDAFRLIVRFL